MDLKIRKKKKKPKQDKLRSSVLVKGPKLGIAGDCSDSRGIRILLCPTSSATKTPWKLPQN